MFCNIRLFCLTMHGNVYVRPQIGAKSISILEECLRKIDYKLKD